MTNTSPELICYKTLPEWDSQTLPKGFREKHNTKVGTWAKLTIFSGKLQFYALDEDGNVLETRRFDSEHDTPFIEPQAWHKVEPLSDDLRCQLAFYCTPEDYYQKKYKLSATHSEVLQAVDIIKSQMPAVNHNSLSALDLGCGNGRNALYLQQQGFDVVAVDKNLQSITNLNAIIAQENLAHISAHVLDLQQIQQIHEAPEPLTHALTASYDLVISTVVLMFLAADKVPDVIKTMQQRTKVGGYNVIVCAIESEDYPYEN